MAIRKSLRASDQVLVQIVDSALTDATRRSGSWLLCEAGCTQCCVGVFPISQLDAWRLRRGLADLQPREPMRAERIRTRAHDARGRLVADYPGDPVSGVLYEGAEAERQFSVLGNNEVCPVLDPQTGKCDLYESRPITCRVFGPPVRSEGGLGVCELCFHGATEKEIAACEMRFDPDDLESVLVEKLENDTGVRGQTIIAFCLAD